MGGYIDFRIFVNQSRSRYNVVFGIFLLPMVIGIIIIFTMRGLTTKIAWTIIIISYVLLLAGMGETFFNLFLPPLLASSVFLSYLSVLILIFFIFIRTPNDIKMFELTLFSIGVILAIVTIACFFGRLISRDYIRFTIALIRESSQ